MLQVSSIYTDSRWELISNVLVLIVTNMISDDNDDNDCVSLQKPCLDLTYATVNLSEMPASDTKYEDDLVLV